MIKLSKDGKLYTVRRSRLVCPMVYFDPDTGEIEIIKTDKKVPNFDLEFVNKANPAIQFKIKDAAGKIIDFRTLSPATGEFSYRAVRINYFPSYEGSINIYYNSPESKTFDYEYPLYTISEYRGTQGSNTIKFPEERNLQPVLKGHMTLTNVDLSTNKNIIFDKPLVTLMPSDNDNNLNGLYCINTDKKDVDYINFDAEIKFPKLNKFLGRTDYKFTDYYDLGTLVTTNYEEMNTLCQYHTMPTETPLHAQKFILGPYSDEDYVPNGLYGCKAYSKLAYEDPVAMEVRHHLYPTCCAPDRSDGIMFDDPFTYGRRSPYDQAVNPSTSTGTYIGYYGSNKELIDGTYYYYLVFVHSYDVIGIRIMKGIDPADPLITQEEKDKKTFVYCPSYIIPQGSVQAADNNAVTGHKETAIATCIPSARLNGSYAPYQGMMYITPITMEGIQEDKTIMAKYEYKEEQICNISPLYPPITKTSGGGIIIDPNVK